MLVMELNSEEEAVAFTDDCDRFCRWAYRVMGAVVTAGIGRACDSLFTINQSYAGAREAVSYRVLYGTQRAINIGEIAPTEQEISGSVRGYQDACFIQDDQPWKQGRDREGSSE